MSHMRTSSPSRLSSIEHDTGMQLGRLHYTSQMAEGQLPLVIAHLSCVKQLGTALGTTAQFRCMHSVCTSKQMQHQLAGHLRTDNRASHLAMASTSSMLQTSILLYTYKHFTYFLFPCSQIQVLATLRGVSAWEQAC